jgi:hypothetical protein
VCYGVHHLCPCVRTHYFVNKTFLLGEEVALYCAKYLPDIIKDQKAYKEGKLQKVCLSTLLILHLEGSPWFSNL